MIHLLERDLASKIAAGEVIERPSSVVKELVENSLDAGASQVTVEVRGGGIELLRVVDNGSGIPADEVSLAFQRHATSKITSSDDLDRIMTMGFRGEALPSIASVAMVKLVSRENEVDGGREVQVSWGEGKALRSVGCPVGTSVTVERLFENLPARRKFLRSPSAEAARINDLMSRLALAFPDVAFRLQVDGRNVLTTSGNGVLNDAIISVYGAEACASMLEVVWDGPGDGYKVSGYVGAPSFHKSNRTYITFLLNRRWIQSPMLSAALSETYHGFLPERRYPVAVLNISIPPGEVDVNVHPAKREVRFRHDDRVFGSLQRAVRGTLVAVAPVPEIHIPSSAPPSSQGGPILSWSSPRSSAGTSYTEADPAVSRADVNPTPLEGMSSLRIIGQMKYTYLVAEGPEGMFLIDQHAAHERVLYERVSKDVADRGTQVQALLQPVSVELSPEQEELLQANSDLLESYGYLLEPFGERTYLVRGIPGVAATTDPAKALLEVLDMMSYEGALRERNEAMAASIACHSAIRAGMAMNEEQMEGLVRQLRECDSPHTCPHGRPTMIHLSSYHLEREFGRRK
ncbi:MAG: DNA mismatch repair endonuclease MutL [Dehalococcoidia bacterium]|nr:DNA mismatch repair endonuclease MutL [Dehalococcoidia bacterium]